ncbi:hypothetical protein CXF85_13270 [Colwellia sp. 75C3]|uniref:hypothetical protein n=1 Tax=Colwellia sp. 75C3 TaxID=888425 RepID=UPI000C31C664|nr:hypothetical protein [Colwellia sp. 75C3]PKG82454.1 hypothetical protein CXF85_13270 [Colwellia sp. 75C3]
MHSSLTSFLIKFLLLLSASLSLHSALAVPLSSLLASKYHAVAESTDLTNTLNNHTDSIEDYNRQTAPSKRKISLLTLLQQDDNDNLARTLFIATINELATDLVLYDAQSLARQSYQEQLTTHTHIQGTQNTLYAQKPCYQAKLQYQQNLS